MSVQDVESEIRSVFKEAMSKNENFPFTYLQSTGCGSRSLTVPSLSSSFNWTVHQVAKLGSNKGTMYVMEEKELNVALEVSVHVYFLHVLVYLCIELRL